MRLVLRLGLLFGLRLALRLVLLLFVCHIAGIGEFAGVLVVFTVRVQSVHPRKGKSIVPQSSINRGEMQCNRGQTRIWAMTVSRYFSILARKTRYALFQSAGVTGFFPMQSLKIFCTLCASLCFPSSTTISRSEW